ncbi:hypothetical protein [Aquabacterium sp.]|uniref:O-linked N-acetylglucosamine transferase, SPINDLY family protein n=1 Tax=Aquabacterium sp. TaxID=1872578 RepID=UPI0024892A8F|nr:hypothetical protein [Aquabacterium sp.]MDI1260998.1 hypothetical protein [Aquabacterium sp.]
MPGISPAPLPPGRSEAEWLAHCAQVSQLGTDAMLQAALEAAVSDCPSSVRLLYNLGVAQQRLGAPAQAQSTWQRLLAIDTQHLKARRGLARLALDQLDGPKARHHAALLNQAGHAAGLPATAQDLGLWGKACLMCGDWDDARHHFERAAGLAPTAQADACDEAEQGLRLSTLLTWRAQSPTPPWQDWGDQALRHDPTAPDSPPWDRAPPEGDDELKALTVIVELGLKRLRACDWRERDTVVRAIKRIAQKAMHDPTVGLSRSMAWEGLHLGLTPAELLHLARGCTQRARHIQQPQALWTAAPAGVGHRRLRLGYLSHNFGRHPTTQLIHRILKHHDRTQFEVIAYALNPDDGSPSRKLIHAAVDQVVEASQWLPEAVARRMHADQVDVLIGLGGHSRGPVVDVALWRPAPVQINYLAFCGTVGAPDAFDVHISDGISVTPEMAHWYDEAVEALPVGHYGYDDTRELTAAPARASQGLPEDQLVLCGFNNSYKIEPETFNAWCKVMHRLPGAVLWLYVVHPEQSRFLAAEAARRGIDPARLVFAPSVDGQSHLARLRCADLFLDTLAYNGHTTLLDALYAGLPAVSCLGQTAASRIGGAILHEVGLGACVATNPLDFVEVAVRLAQDPAQRQQISRQLEGVRGRETPFNSELRCRQLEAVYARLFMATAGPAKPA